MRPSVTLNDQFKTEIIIEPASKITSINTDSQPGFETDGSSESSSSSSETDDALLIDDQKLSYRKLSLTKDQQQ